VSRLCYDPTVIDCLTSDGRWVGRRLGRRCCATTPGLFEIKSM
jgi:hypothetical protein